MESISGIYEIVNIENGNRYVGSSGDIHDRWKHHKNSLNINKHQNRHLQNAWNKYGEKSFTIAIIENCPRDLLLVREQFHIDNLNPEYNLAPVSGSCLGVKHTQAARDKKSKSKIGNKNWAGRFHTLAARMAISAANIGKVVGVETRRKIGDANKGKVRSLETRARMSAAQKGRLITKEHREKISIALKKKIYKRIEEI